MKTEGVPATKNEKPTVSRANKGGRRSKDASLVSSEKLTLYLTPSEMSQLTSSHEQARQGTKLSLNEFAKRRLLSPRKIQITSPVGLTQYGLKKLSELVNELRHIGVNYNQSVKRINQYHFPEQLRSEFQKNAVLAGEILDLVKQTKLFYETLENSINK